MRQFIIGTAGHIDHGKTALVRALTGTDTDRLREEKERGISIDLGFAYLDLGDIRLGIIDVPGHERFVRNMLAGAAGIDLAVLVVAADDSVMPQTREHLAILQLLQIPRGVIVITKCDLVEPDWLDLVEQDVRALVQNTFLNEAPIVRTAAPTGKGLDELRVVLGRLCEETQARSDTRLFRMPIDRAFVLKGLGTVVTGTVWSGALEREQEVEWLPVGRRIKARAMHSHGAEVDVVRTGQRAACNLPGVHHDQIERGHELASPGLLAPARRLAVRVTILADAPRPLRHRARVRLHLGTQESIVQIRLLETNELRPGESSLAQFTAAMPVLALGGQPFVIRDESPVVTIGGGVVLLPNAAPISRRDAATIERLREIDGADPQQRIALAIRFRQGTSWTALDLCRDTGLAPEDVERAVNALVSAGEIVRLPLRVGSELRAHREDIEAIGKRLLAVLRDLHEQAPLESVLPRSRIEQRLAYVDRSLLHAVLDALIREGTLVGDDQAIALANFAPMLSEEEKRFLGRVVTIFREAKFQPPDLPEVTQTLGLPAKKVQELVDIAVHCGQLIHLGGGLFLHYEQEGALRDRIIDELKDGATLTLSEIRQMLETTRKYAVPICEYLDQQGITQRRGDTRSIGSAGRAQLEATSTAG